MSSMSRNIRVAVLCEFSGTVRDAFRRRGFDAVSCDLLETEAPGPHIVGDCRDHDWSDYDLVVAHPPCTYLCNSGVRWLWNGDKAERQRWLSMLDAVEFFEWCRQQGRANATENPIMHGYAAVRVGKPTQIVQPWQYGHGETKATGLWLRGLPKLAPTQIVEGREARVHRAPPSPDRWKVRSMTSPGIADAMAQQWGDALTAKEVVA